MKFHVSRLPFGVLACGLLSMGASAATLCVDPSGAAPCYTRIADAVAAAAPGDAIHVGPGTYNESITIRKPLSLTTDNAILDAMGLNRGFFVDGLSAPGLARVNISGFTIRNANYEGILVLNASMVTLSNNSVTGNDRSLNAGTCAGLDAFETNEQSDCGEGIHLMGVDHSVVTNNSSIGNSGGILISDDTAATHDNLISFNTVNNNPYACGITMASHAAYVPAGATATVPAYGVFHNTVYANRVRANGLANGGGAGAGIFASVPGAAAYGNVVVANLLTENGLPGVAMHAHAPGQNLNDNLVVGNTVINNGPDTQDAATPGPAGINVYSLAPVTGNMIVGNTVQQEAVDVAIKVPAPVQVQFNSLEGNGIGVANLGTPGPFGPVGPVIATENFWSCPNGPTNPGSCSTVYGTNVAWAPWLTNPLPVLPSF